jgi:hypothetical protein
MRAGRMWLAREGWGAREGSKRPGAAVHTHYHARNTKQIKGLASCPQHPTTSVMYLWLYTYYIPTISNTHRMFGFVHVNDLSKSERTMSI